MRAVGLPDEAYLCALASLPDATPARLRAVAHLAPRDALEAIAAGRWHWVPQLAELLDRPVRRARARSGGSSIGAEHPTRSPVGDGDGRAAWQRAAAAADPEAAWDHHRQLEVGVWPLASPDMPAAFATDLEPPPVIFLRGDPSLLHGANVAIVGTRRCTRYGRDIARGLGRDLAERGFGVVSGLAAGIDAAAHQGVLEAGGGSFARDGSDGLGRPVGVVGTGLDVPYPRSNAELWHRVADTGVLCSEYPLGTPPAPWRFPARNRLIVAASDVVVVVESHGAGGALITAREALARGRTVLSVPGPIHSPASVGTNALLSEGAHPCLGLDDVVCALGLSVGEPDARVVDAAPAGLDAEVLDALGWVPASLDQLALRTGAPLPQLSLVLTRLVAAGAVADHAGFYERVAP